MQFAQQIPLDFPVMPAFGREDFMIGDSNIDAARWIDRWPDWPAPVLFLCGPAASGKSHLGAVWQARAHGVYIPAAQLKESNAQDIAAKGAHLFIDNIDPWFGDAQAETTLFHLYNMFKEQGRTILMTGRAAPAHIHFEIADLASRLRGAPCAIIKSPDDALLQNILVKMFADRQIMIGEDVIQYLTPRMERSFKFISDIVEQSDKIALSKKRAVTVPIIREALSAIVG